MKTINELREDVKEFSENNPSDISEHLLKIFDIVINNKPKIIVELGVRDGNSTFILSKAGMSIGASLISVDINDCSGIRDKFDVGKDWTFYQIDDLNLELDNIDLLLIDTNHEYEHTIKELRKFIPLMNLEGTILMHDTNLSASKVNDAIEVVFKLGKLDWNKDFKLENKKIKIENYSHNNGLAVITLLK